MTPKPRGMPQQAFSPSYRSPRAGYRQRGGSSLYYTDGSKIPGARIDARPQAARMMGGRNEGPLAQRGQMWSPSYKPQTRQGNIDKAREDGTFDMKRAAYNAANKGSFMDERGIIGPKAPLPTGNPVNERVPVSTPSTPTATTPPAAKPEVMGTPRPATFEGKSRAEWFGAAAKRQGQSNAYSGEALTQAQAAKPAASPATPAAKSAAPAAVAATPKPAPTPTSQTPAGVPKPTFDDPDAKDRYNNAMASISPQAAKPVPATTPSTAPAPSTSKASWFSSASQKLTQGAQGMMTDRAANEKRIAELEQQAKPGMEKIADAAKGAAVGAAKGVQLPAKAIAAPVKATIAGAQEAGRKIGETVNNAVQGVKNFMQGDQSAAQEAAKLKAEINPPSPTPVVSDDEDKKKRVATK